MNSPLVSIIIPVYNVELYLRECLDSIIKQEYSFLEIIIIDDGSNDNSKSIAEMYSTNDKRVIFISQENIGQGATRNRGISIASGEYILFVDSDDFIEKGLIKHLVETIGNSELLVYNGKAFMDFEKKYELNQKSYFPIAEKYSNMEIDGIAFFQENYNCVQPCLKMYRRDFIIKYGIKFPEGIYGEDVSFWLEVCMKAKLIKYTYYLGYNRRYRPNSVMTTTSFKNIYDRIIGYKYILKVIEEISDCKTKKLINYLFYEYLIWIWRETIEFTDEDLINLYNNEGLKFRILEQSNTLVRIIRYIFLVKNEYLAKIYYKLKSRVKYIFIRKAY